jgi:hypothetical protein
MSLGGHMSLGMTGGYSSMAEAVGEAPWQQGGYEPSHSWTSSELAEIEHDDPEFGLEGVRLVTENDAARTMARLEQENSRLRERIAELEADDGDDEGGTKYPAADFRYLPGEGGEDAHLDAAYEDRFDTGMD